MVALFWMSAVYWMLVILGWTEIAMDGAMNRRVFIASLTISTGIYLLAAAVIGAGIWIFV